MTGNATPPAQPQPPTSPGHAARIELLEIRDFLAEHPPWDALPPAALAELPRQITVRYLKRGSAFPPEGRPSAWIVRQGAVELRDGDGGLIDKLGEGELHLDDEGKGRAGKVSGSCVEDSLFYVLPLAVLDHLRAEHPALEHHFELSVRRAAAALTAPGDSATLMATPIGDLVVKPPLVISPQASILEAAQRMSQERVSSLLVMTDDQLEGIVTDRDLRSRCLAAGVPPSAPVESIMTREVRSAESDTAAFRALMTMATGDIHHLPVTRQGRVVGVISTTDLIRREASNPAYLVRGVRRAADVDALAALAAGIPSMQLRMTTAGADAAQVGEAVSGMADAITLRLLELAEARLGPPPVPYLWLAAGSQARHEQTSLSDQDNALILSDLATQADDDYFKSLASFVNAGLAACGFVLCPGGVMAQTDTWRQPLARWRQYFHEWIERPTRKALMLASVFFDLRPVHGDRQLLDALLEEMMPKTRGNSIFLACLAANALTHRPPLGFFRDFVLISGGEHDQTFDIKHRGIVPIVDLARQYALSVGVREVNTLARLRAAAGSEVLSQEGAQDLADAWTYIARLRLLHQTAQVRAGSRPDNFLAPTSLSNLERQHLQAAFKVIATMQSTLARRYPGSSLP